MQVLNNLKDTLIKLRYSANVFETASEAATYLNSQIDNTTVGFGGSATADALGLYESLGEHNEVYWHWKQDANEAYPKAATADIYITSANAIAKTGEMVNMDGRGNRVSATLFGHKKVYFVIGKNKITETYEDAVWRTRNVAAPKRAQQLNCKTPCAIKADKCYKCNSPQKVCRAMVTFFAPMMDMEAEVILINEDLGL